jgi:4-alpha-glucanotransferase
MRSRTPYTGEGLAKRAARWGVETQFRDAFGSEQRADPEGLARVLGAVAGMEKPAPRLAPSTVVLRQGQGARLRLKRNAHTPLRWEIFEQARIVGGESVSSTIALPADLPLGIYGLKIAAQASGAQRSEAATLLSVPHQAFQGPLEGPRRLWVLAVQLYGVRSRRNWGHGDFTDLSNLLALAAELGAAGIGLNPLHVLSDDRAEAASPYSPNSRLFLNPLYIDVDAVPEFPGLADAGLQREIAALAQRELVDYEGMARVKARALRLAYENFRRASPFRRQAFEDFRSERGSVLGRFACFEFLRRHLGRPWREWPAQWRNPTDADLAELRGREDEQIAFFEFVQWVADEQLQACRLRARDLALPIGLYLDIAVGVRPDGFDAWSDQDSVMTGLAVGAPPDLCNTAGQNWGLAAFKPVALEQKAFQPFRQMLQASMRNAGAIRLDHVLGLKRLYLIPDGMRTGQGVYVRFPFQALLAVSALESVAHRCLVIGEDLGTVPEDFRDAVADWGLWSYHVMLFERAADGSFLTPEHYRENALVTFSTHDLATFAGWASGHDLAVKRALGMDPGETDAERAAAQRAMHRALSRAGAADLDFPSVARFLAQTPARLMVVAIEDALGVCDQANVPATIDEHPNWRRRWPVALEDLARHAGLRVVADVMKSAGRAIGGHG